MPAESNVWFNLGVAALTVAGGAAITAMGLTNNQISEAILWTVAACFGLFAISLSIVHWDVNRGRRIKRSVVEEDAEEFDAESK